MTISVKVNREDRTIVWSSERTATVVTARIAAMSDAVRERAMYHGVTQRGSDSGAMGFDHWDGKDKPKRYATDHEKLARIGRTIEHLNNPATGWDWDLRPSADPLAGKSEAELKALIAAAQQRLQPLGI